MSVDKAPEIKGYEIDKIKRRHRTDDTIVATVVACGCGEDTVQHNTMEKADEGAGKPTELSLQGNSHLVSSTTSSLADTPGDSGVLCLDSEASEATSQALMSHSLIGAEELTCDSVYDAPPSCSQDMIRSTTSSVMTRSDIDNQNLGALDDIVPELIVETNQKQPYENLPDVVLKALESEKVVADEIRKPALRTNEPKKSLSEDIVYRRRCRKKSQSGPSSQKKRVSFHEDILNNTKTDNIHIERGFISYVPDGSYCDKFRQKNNGMTDRFSWCASGDRTPKYAADVAQQTMSDILTYGSSKNDKSGIFEYSSTNQEHGNDSNDKDNNNDQQRSKLYGCDSNSSDSNFSCDSETSSSDSSSSHSNKTETTLLRRKCEKAQKSYSCDGFENNGHVAFMRKTYFSEADIDQSHNRAKQPLEVTQSPSKINEVKSVLKKKRYITTNIVQENKKNRKVLNLLDTNNIIDSLKNFYKNFNFNFTPEKGLPESSFELNNVVEALASDVNQSKSISKSLDSGFQIEDEDDFVEINLNGRQLDTIKVNKDTNPTSKNTVAGERTPNGGSPRHKLTLNMKSTHDKKSVGKGDFPPLSRYVVNCESTVYEHKGVSYSYVHDTFQTAFDAPKESFVPIPETTPVTEMTTSTSKTDIKSLATTTNKSDTKSITASTSRSDLRSLTDAETSSKTSTPKRQFNKNVQDETEQKNGVPKHLSSPKKQNVNRYRKPASTVQKLAEEIPQVNSENCSNTDNSTLKGAEDFNDELFDSPANQKLQSSKSALLNRYLKNVCQRKDLELKIRNNKFYQIKLLLEKRFPSIIFPFKDVSESFHVSAARMSRLIDKEVIENKRLSVRLLTADEPSYFDSFEDNVAIECNEKLRLQIFSYPNETLNRVSYYIILSDTFVGLSTLISIYLLLPVVI